MTTSKGRKAKTGAPASVLHRPHLLEWLKDPANAAAYVEAALEEDDPAGFTAGAPERGRIARRRRAHCRENGPQSRSALSHAVVARQSAAPQLDGHIECNGTASQCYAV